MNKSGGKVSIIISTNKILPYSIAARNHWLLQKLFVKKRIFQWKIMAWIMNHIKIIFWLKLNCWQWKIKNYTNCHKKHNKMKKLKQLKIKLKSHQNFWIFLLKWKKLMINFSFWPVSKDTIYGLPNIMWDKVSIQQFSN